MSQEWWVDFRLLHGYIIPHMDKLEFLQKKNRQQAEKRNSEIEQTLPQNVPLLLSPPRLLQHGTWNVWSPTVWVKSEKPAAPIMNLLPTNPNSQHVIKVYFGAFLTFDSVWSMGGNWSKKLKTAKLETERRQSFLTIQYFWSVIQADSVWILKLQG